jgi:hypothetical protein
VAKVPGSRLYRVTERGHRVMGLAIRFRLLDFPQALAAFHPNKSLSPLTENRLRDHSFRGI